jgi:HAD superfamily hydrolase (TIGR01490 family)
MKTLALFDFDGTVTYKDSFLEFIKFYRGTPRFLAGMAMLSPWLISMKLGLIPNWKVKERALKKFFGGEPIEKFDKVCQDFCRQKVPTLIKADALEKINKHLADGDRVVLVSASLENWLKPWTDQIGIELLGSRLEIVQGKITGKLLGKNCHGPEKCSRIRAHLPVGEYNIIHAYGDTSGDREMLAMAHNPNYRVFKG